MAWGFPPRPTGKVRNGAASTQASATPGRGSTGRGRRWPVQAPFRHDRFRSSELARLDSADGAAGRPAPVTRPRSRRRNENGDESHAPRRPTSRTSCRRPAMLPAIGNTPTFQVAARGPHPLVTGRAETGCTILALVDSRGAAASTARERRTGIVRLHCPWQGKPGRDDRILATPTRSPPAGVGTIATCPISDRQVLRSGPPRSEP